MIGLILKALRGDARRSLAIGPFPPPAEGSRTASRAVGFTQEDRAWAARRRLRRNRSYVIDAAILIASLAFIAWIALSHGKLLRPPEKVDGHIRPGLISERLLYCEDGSRIDLDVMDGGRTIQITNFTNKASNRYRSENSGRDFINGHTRAIPTHGSIAFVTAGQPVLHCHVRTHHP